MTILSTSMVAQQLHPYTYALSSCGMCERESFNLQLLLTADISGDA